MRLHETGSPFENAIKYRDDFIKWWQAHSHSFVGGSVEDADVLNHRIQVRGNEKQELCIDSPYKFVIQDHTISRLPFRFGRISQLILAANKLSTLEGAPEQCNMFALESENSGQNNTLESIAHGPQHAEHMAFTLARPLRTLENNLRGPIESIWIHAPSIVSFEGMNVHCHELVCNIPMQKSVTGIHKQLKNVEELALVLDPDFDGGLLSVAMIKGLKRVYGAPNSANRRKPFNHEKVFDAINAGIIQGWNVHELQERLIEAGLGKFARL